MKSKLAAFLVSMFFLLTCQPDTYRQGRVLYEIHCENCHMEDGSGLFDLIPSLAKSGKIASQSLSVPCLIRDGLPRNPETGQQMPANKQLNDVEITNLINYLRHLYYPDSTALKVSDVRQALSLCP